MMWLVQVKFPVPVPASAPDGWVTVAAAEGMREAGHAAAFVYRDRDHPDDSYPTQLRIRTDDDIAAHDGEAAMAAALESLRAFGVLTADREGGNARPGRG